MTKFSIIVVAYQRYKEIKCLLHSLLSQTYDNFEVIVLHDGHDEQHANIMSEFLTDDRFKYIQTPTRFNDWGMSLRNIGLEMVTGDYVINTNDDNYYVPVYLDELNKTINGYPECNFVYYDCVLNHHNILNHNQKDYGLLIPKLKSCYIDMGQFAVKKDIIIKYRFKSTSTADGELVEEMNHELKPEYIDKILFVHN
jgi:glycosyltransferase involved in cell wall biosynthesis